jgi:hypothetical protein
VEIAANQLVVWGIQSLSHADRAWESAAQKVGVENQDSQYCWWVARGQERRLEIADRQSSGTSDCSGHRKGGVSIPPIVLGPSWQGGHL